ncbi:MAG: cobalamin biosynthesis protein CobW [Rhodospirillaceae bacterium]|jgi:cobalamin biosynthesis protein CobW|nr:cobalamin biosynthesis protein CobW [Rhodospirillaceae bacterium]MBT6118980.1 cobalamin biosynthesis protein CobW [Rhodospirillaceae bacterium]
MSLPVKIPATVITGFLGSGKTSLIRKVLEGANGRRFALIINEFGDLGVDRDIIEGCGIEGCGEDDIVELANGCICCTVAEDFLPTIEKLLDRPNPPEHIIIETSGLALPKPLVKAFNWPEIKSRVTVDGVIAVIDAAAVSEGRFADDPEAVEAQRRADPMLDHDNPLEEVFEDQLHCADMVILNKCDLVDEAARGRIDADLRAALRPAVKFVHTSHGEVPTAVLLGLDAAAEDDLDARPSHHDGAADDHDHDDFDTATMDLPEIDEPEIFAVRLADIAQRFDVLRMKGFATVPGKPMRLVIQGVGDRIQHHFDRPWKSGEKRRGRLVVIGLKGLDLDGVGAALRGEA